MLSAMFQMISLDSACLLRLLQNGGNNEVSRLFLRYLLPFEAVRWIRIRNNFALYTSNQDLHSECEYEILVLAINKYNKERLLKEKK